MDARRGLVSFLLLLSLPLTARAQTAIQVLDIDGGFPETGASSAPRNLTVVGGKLFFTADEPSSGRELWVSDGTSTGTGMLADICPGGCSSDPMPRGSLGKLLLFTDYTLGLWRSDGTRAGTFALAAQTEGVIVFLGDAAFFPVCDSDSCRLWTTDGTIAGTSSFADLGQRQGGYHAFQGLIAGRRMFWVRSDFNTAKNLWVSDGTASGTTALTLLPSARQFTVAAGKLFFLASQGQGEELWASDGTVAGTRPLTYFISSAPFAATAALKAGASGVYFAADDSAHGVDLWKNDGTEAGTVRVTALAPNQPFVPQLDPAQIEETGGRTVVIAFDQASGFRLFASGGTPASTISLGAMAVSPYTGLVRAGGRIYFRADDGVHGYELWSTDGRVAGTAMVRDICPGPCLSQLTRPRALGNGVVFLASDLVHGAQVWTSDGTAAGTRAHTHLSRGSLFGLGFEVVTLGSRLYFPAADGHGEELWTAGPGAGNGRLVNDVAGSGSSSAPQELTKMGNLLLFTACDGISREVWGYDATEGDILQLTDFRLPGSCSEGRYSPNQRLYLTSDGEAVALFWHYQDPGGYWLWRTDGSPAGTEGTVIRFADPERGLLVHDGVEFFVVNHHELWRSDGTAPGTRKVCDLPSDTYLTALAWVGQSLYLGFEKGLYRSDGVSADLVPVSTLLWHVGDFTQAGVRLYFFANGELWTSDGTPEGTHAVSSIQNLRPIEMTELGGKVYFLARAHPSAELWRSDGTPAGTVRLAQIPLEGNDLDPGDLVVAAGRLFFSTADGTHGRELWTSDGTAGGTVLVRDLVPGPTSSSPSHLAAFAGKLYFSAWDSAHGNELWVSDGSAAGTRLVQDVAPEGLSSAPAEPTAIGDKLFFTADDGLAGRELWVLPANGVGCQPAADRLCLGGGRFAVTVAWRDFAGHTGIGRPIPLTADTGGFWFFAPENLELAVKVLDGRALNNAFWVFYGALSNVEYEITVTDTETGLTRRYQNPPGQLASVGDTHGFGPLGAYSVSPPSSLAAMERIAAEGRCAPGPGRLCLNGGRFAVEAAWKDSAGNTGTGMAVPLSGDTGTFWFFSPTNLEVFTKVLDGTALNGKFWFFYGALSNVEYTLTVTDTQTGAVRAYHNPAGRFASVADTGAF